MVRVSRVSIVAGVRDSVKYSVVTDSEFGSESANFSGVRPHPNLLIFGSCK